MRRESFGHARLKHSFSQVEGDLDSQEVPKPVPLPKIEQLYHERLCLENKVLHLMFYYELKLYWMKVCWLYEISLLLFSTFVLKTKVF